MPELIQVGGNSTDNGCRNSIEFHLVVVKLLIPSCDKYIYFFCKQNWLPKCPCITDFILAIVFICGINHRYYPLKYFTDQTENYAYVLSKNIPGTKMNTNKSYY